MDIESIKESIQKLPSWVWIVGGGVVLIVAYFFLKGSGSSSTTTGTGQTSDFTSALSSLGDAITGIGSGGGGSSTTSGSDTTGSDTTGKLPAPVDNGNPIAYGTPIKGPGGTSAPVTPTPITVPIGITSTYKFITSTPAPVSKDGKPSTIVDLNTKPVTTMSNKFLMV